MFSFEAEIYPPPQKKIQKIPLAISTGVQVVGQEKCDYRFVKNDLVFTI